MRELKKYGKVIGRKVLRFSGIYADAEHFQYRDYEKPVYIEDIGNVTEELFFHHLYKQVDGSLESIKALSSGHIAFTYNYDLEITKLFDAMEAGSFPWESLSSNIQKYIIEGYKAYIQDLLDNDVASQEDIDKLEGIVREVIFNYGLPDIWDDMIIPVVMEINK